MTDALTLERLREILELALAAAGDLDALVRVSASSRGATRYANNVITQNMTSADAAVSVTVSDGGRSGSASTNDLDHDAVLDCVTRAAAIAAVVPPDPEFMSPVGPHEIDPVDCWAPSTADCDPLRRAELVGQAVAVAVASGAGNHAAGALSTRAGLLVLGNSAGARHEFRGTSAEMTVSVTAGEAVGWAQGIDRRLDAIETSALARRAAGKALAARQPADLPAGAYDVVFEPEAVCGLVQHMVETQLDARAADEGRTALAGMLGQQVAAPLVHLYSDPRDARCPARPFDGDGLPLERTDWIRGGSCNTLTCSRYWAKQQGREPVGWPTNLIMAGGEATTEQLISSVQRGILVTRLWYIRSVEVKRALATGMTRDGTFLIEDGAIVGPVKNLRFNQDILAFLASIEQLGAQELVSDSPYSLMPAVLARDFQFTSTTGF